MGDSRFSLPPSLLCAPATTLIGHLEPFKIEGDDWELYTERLDQFLLANGIDDDKKNVAVLVTVIGQKAYALLRN